MKDLKNPNLMTEKETKENSGKIKECSRKTIKFKNCKKNYLRF